MLEKVRADLIDPRKPVAGRECKTVGLVADQQFARHFSIPPRCDEFRHRVHESVRRQRTGLFENPFFCRNIGHTAHKQIGDRLIKFFSRTIFQNSFSILINERVPL